MLPGRHGGAGWRQVARTRPVVVCVEAGGTLAPQRKLANEKPQGETVDYDALIKSWPATPPRRS